MKKVGRKHKKEKIYDELISPLMKQIILICKENNISFFADFIIGNNQEESCTSLLNEEKCSKYTLMNFLRQVSCKDGFDMDSFLTAVNKTYPKNKSSYYMDKLFENGDWRKENKEKN